MAVQARHRSRAIRPGRRRRDFDAAVPLRARARRGPQGPRGPAGRAGREAARRRGVDHRPGRGRRRPRADHQAARATGALPVIVYMHGGGWILGNAATHDRLVRELAVGARAALLFVEYPNSPEAHYPVAIEQGYATAQWAIRDGASKGLDRHAGSRSRASRSAATWPPR